MQIRWLAIVVLGILGALGAHSAGEILVTNTPWRYHVSYVADPGDAAQRLKVPRGFGDPFVVWGYGIDSPTPPANWAGADFDDAGWVCRSGSAFGDYGYRQDKPALICMRGRFQVDDPAQARGLRLALTYRGGVVVYLNGTEIARGHLPGGAITPRTLAAAYPTEAFVTEDGNGLLPDTWRGALDAQIKPRYDARFRTLTADLPARLLRPGVNVLALEIHPAGIPQELPEVGGKVWNPAGLVALQLTADGGATPNTGGTGGIAVWVAHPMQLVGRDISGGDLAGTPGTLALTAPINGVCSGQVVVSDQRGPATPPLPAPNIAATISPLTKPGVVIPAGAVHIRYADVSKSWVPLLDTPVRNSVQPVWVTVQVPVTAPAGTYTGTLTITGLDAPVQVPVRLSVIGWRVPAPRDRQTWTNFLQSPESVAGYYKVPLWSDAHFRLLESSFRLMGECGNAVLGINALGQDVFGDDPVIVFRKAGDTYVPELKYLERYLSLYDTYAGAPRVLALQVWHYGMSSRGYGRDGGGVKEVADTFPAVELQGDRLVPIQLPMYGKPGTEACWRAVMDGIKAQMARLGWRNTRILLGTGGDNWPDEQIVDFFKQIAPEAQWRVITHGQGCPKWGETDQQRTQPNHMVVGLLEMARRTGSLRQRFPLAPVSSNARDHVGAHPYQMRELPLLHTGRCNYDGFAWKGLDYWTYTDANGQQRSALNTYVHFGNVVGGTPRAIAAPGPEGAVATQQFENLREGCQDTEAYLTIQAALRDPARRAKLGEARAAAISAEVEGILDMVETGDRLCGAGDYLAGMRRLYELAAEVSGK